MDNYIPEEYEPMPVKPAVWTWYVVYCIAMALLYLGVTVLGVFLLILPEDAVKIQDMETVKIQAIACIIVGIPLFFLYLIAPFLPKKPWAWIYGIVMIAFSLTSCCCMVAGIPLLIYWIKPDVKRFFGKTDD